MTSPPCSACSTSAPRSSPRDWRAVSERA
jgi:hypothetical protein